MAWIRQHVSYHLASTYEKGDEEEENLTSAKKKKKKFITFSMPVMLFDTQFCDSARMLTVCSILQKSKQIPRDIKWLACLESHN